MNKLVVVQYNVGVFLEVCLINNSVRNYPIDQLGNRIGDFPQEDQDDDIRCLLVDECELIN